MTYHRTLRTYDVLEYPWAAHYCHKYLKLAFELFDRGRNIYSNRPHLIVANGILCDEGLFTPLMSYGDVFVCPFFDKLRNLSLLLVGGVALATPYMRFSPK